MLENRREPIDRLCMLTDAKLRPSCMNGNATEANLTEYENIYAAFEGQVETSPHSIAVIQCDVALSYRQLAMRVRTLAHCLAGLGVGPDVAVGLFVGRSIDFLIGALAVLGAGGAYVPIDPQYPEERIRRCSTKRNVQSHQ